jgi:chaperone BCS1
MPPSASSLVRRLSAALASDSSGQSDLLELTFVIVLRNLLVKVQRYSAKVDLLLRIIIPYLVLLAGVYGILRGTISSLWNLVTVPLTSRITVPADHSVNADVLAWLVAHGQVSDVRGLVLIKKPSLPAVLEFIPNFGRTRFRYKGHFMSMERANGATAGQDGKRTVSLDPTAPQNLTLECFPSFCATDLLKRLLEDVSGFSNPLKEDTTTVYRPHSHLSNRSVYVMMWIAAVARPSRSLDSVALEASKKDALVTEIAHYLTAQYQRFCANRGCPYRRGFLLYGPPGTGKTSFCLALAGHFNLGLYILNLSDDGMTDEGLESLFHCLPSPCIVLIEDIDSAGLEREKTKE